MRRAWAHLLACAGFVAAAGARAGAKGDTERAKQVFEQALKLDEKGEYARACPLFKSAVELDPNAVGGKFHLAHCYEKLGKLATAVAEYQQAESAATIAGQRARAAYAREQIDALTPKLATLAIVVPEPFRKLHPDLTIACDGQPVPASSWGLPAPVDAGGHEVSANTQNGSWSARVEVKDGDHAAVDVSGPAAGAPIWPWLAGGAGVALGAVAVGFGVDLARAKSALAAHCPADLSLPCDTTDGFDATGTFNRRDRDTGVVIATSVAAAAGIGAGIAGLVLAHKKRSPAALLPWTSPRAAGLSLRVELW